MIVDFRLKVFVTVAKTLSFTRTAQQLDVTQPAITKHVKELERLLGVPLFVRSRSNISLTLEGKKLLPYAQNILALYQDVNEMFCGDAASFSGNLALGASTTLAWYILPSLLAQFKQQYPNVVVTLSSGNSREISQQVIDGSLDFALVEGDDSSVQLHYEPFMKDEIVLVTSSGNRKLLKDTVAIEDLKNIPLVIRENGSGTLSVIEHALESQNLRRKEMNIVMQLGSTESIIRYLLNSETAAFISISAVWSLLKERRLRIIDVQDLEIVRMLRFVALHGKSNRLAQLFKEFCQQHNRL